MENRTSRIRNEAESVADRVTDKAQDLYGEAQDRASELTDRAGEYASRARGQVNETLERAETRIEEQTGAISMIREYPLAAAGIAFGVGFLMAGSGSSGRKKRSSGLMGRASGQLRSAVLASVSTMLMQELQELLDEHGGPTGLLKAMTGQGSSEPQPQYPR